MPSPMIYQDLTTAALLGHAAQYHSETEIVSVSTGGEKERSSWGEVASRAQRLASALASLGLPPGARCATLAWNNRRHLEIYFAVASGGWVTHTLSTRGCRLTICGISSTTLPTKCCFLTRPFCHWWRSCCRGCRR